MKKVQQGFTLIELMIVVAIIGILAAIAIPAYQDYITRSKVTELITAGSACKTSVSEYFQTQGVLPTDSTQAGCAAVQTAKIASLTVASGAITVTADTTPSTGISALAATEKTYVLRPTATNAGQPIQWSCTGSTILEKYLPANCRG